MAAADLSLRVAVVGSGPAGLYAAEALLRGGVPVALDVLDRLLTPYGLVRYGVAPDHEKIKNVITTLRRVFEHPGVRFLGGVELGVHVTRDELREHYDAVIYATGAAVDRHLGVPGEELPGSHPATGFVAWYSGHPDAVQPFPLDASEVAVLGVGNVAVDVVRMLARAAEELWDTDVPGPVIEALRGSRVRKIHLVGRRGPQHAAFTPKEVRELSELPHADVVVDPTDLAVPDETGLDRHARANLAVLRGWADRPPPGADPTRRTIRLRFWRRPARILGTDRVEGLLLERTRLDEDGRVVGTGEVETLPVQLILRAVGYRSLPLPGLPFDTDRGTVPHVAGRVVDPTGRPLPGEYVAGWLKRGPTGVIGTNKADAAETVATLLGDLTAPGVDRVQPCRPLEELLRERGAPPAGYERWLAIDAAEAQEGAPASRKRVKITEWERLRRLAGTPPDPGSSAT
jgi:ferredoxin--NADP+ reductase